MIIDRSIAIPSLDYEVSFLRLMEKVTNGCTVEINETGTNVVYRPGVIVGGEEIIHDCGLARGFLFFSFFLSIVMMEMEMLMVDG